MELSSGDSQASYPATAADDSAIGWPMSGMPSVSIVSSRKIGRRTASSSAAQNRADQPTSGDLRAPRDQLADRRRRARGRALHPVPRGRRERLERGLVLLEGEIQREADLV